MPLPGVGRPFNGKDLDRKTLFSTGRHGAAAEKKMDAEEDPEVTLIYFSYIK